jgi:hypothetical protein
MLTMTSLEPPRDTVEVEGVLHVSLPKNKEPWYQRCKYPMPPCTLRVSWRYENEVRTYPRYRHSGSLDTQCLE